MHGYYGGSEKEAINWLEKKAGKRVTSQKEWQVSVQMTGGDWRGTPQDKIICLQTIWRLKKQKKWSLRVKSIGRNLREWYLRKSLWRTSSHWWCGWRRDRKNGESWAQWRRKTLKRTRTFPSLTPEEKVSEVETGDKWWSLCSESLCFLKGEECKFFQKRVRWAEKCQEESTANENCFFQ